MSKCSHIMSRDVAYCLPVATVEQAAELMRERNIGCVPVVDNLRNQNLIGIVTDRDLTVRVIGERRDPSRTAVEEIMTKNVVICDSEDTIDHALTLMKRNQIRRLPVVNAAKQLIGMISEADIEAEARGMIARINGVFA